jgi:hypothetical protein
MTASAAATTPTLASTVKWAACLAFTYAAVVIVNATVLQALNRVTASFYLAALFRAALFVMIGIGLLRRARWAWLLGLGLSSLILGVRGIDFGLMLAFRTPWSNTIYPPMVPPVAAVATALLAAIVALLLHPRSRAAIRAAAV